MNKLVCVLILSLKAKLLFAGHFSFEQIYEKYNEIYRQIGNDNNEIKKIEYETSSIKSIKNKVGASQTIKLKTEQEMISYVKKCLFIKEGAYGVHIDDKIQDYLTNSFIDDTSYKFELYAIIDIQLEMINNKCAILLTDSAFKQSLILQGVSWD